MIRACPSPIRTARLPGMLSAPIHTPAQGAVRIHTHPYPRGVLSGCMPRTQSQRKERPAAFYFLMRPVLVRLMVLPVKSMIPRT